MNTLPSTSPIWDIIICPGCGASDLKKETLTYYGGCPHCGYEDASGSIQSIGEQLKSENTEYRNVALPKYLNSVFRVLGLIPDNVTIDIQ